MTKPLKLPFKGLFRVARDTPAINNLVTDAVRPLSRHLPEPWRSKVRAHLQRVGVAQDKLPNGKTMRLCCLEPEPILNLLFYNGWTADEPETLVAWYDLAQQADVIVDIGAHVGLFSIVAALVNPKARIYAFEPLPRVAELLRNNVSLNDVLVEVRQRALGRASGVQPFYAFPNCIPTSSSLDERFMRSTGLDLEKIDVEVSTLDEENIPQGKLLIKIDTETTEPDILAGAAEVLSRAPIIIVEVIKEGLELNGYRPFLLTDRGPVPKERIEPHPRWRNYLLKPCAPGPEGFRW